ncbi:MAG: MFS transporter [Sulfurospirillaceae bacterium]|nr:MFS transporter [Sulfurospirillaceae bacterium]
MMKTIMPITAIIALRFMGLFIVLPVLSVYALGLKGSNEFLVGITIGGYALTQMLLQVPFGMLSDKIGRKITITIGLVIFIIGSLICGFSTDIYTLMLGRFIQGAGAIGAVAIAMISDMVREEVRAKAMAVMGSSIALSFAFAMMAGPLIGGYWGVDKLFFIVAIFTIVAIIILFVKVENPPTIKHNYDNSERQLLEILKNKDLMRMNITNMLQKGMMTLAFLVIPIIMQKQFGWEKKELWMVYIPAMVFGMIAMVPAAIIGEKYHKAKEILMLGIGFFAVSYLIMGYTSSAFLFIVGVIVFFIGFNMHEPLMQSMASKYPRIHQKGTALGIFNSFGYIGTFIGGVFGGYFLQNYGMKEIAVVIVVVAFGWLFIVKSITNPRINKNLYIDADKIDAAQAEKLHDIDGVVEWYKNENENTLIVKHNTLKTNKEEIEAFLGVKP